MIKVVQYSPDLKNLWNDFNKKSKNGLFMFDRDYMDYHADRFRDHSLLFYDDNKILALLPCNIKDNILYSHQGLTFGGFIIDESMKQYKMLNCFDTLKKYMINNNIKKCIYKSIPYIYHKLPSDEDLYALFLNNAIAYRVDCSTTISLKKKIKFNKGRKAQISKAIREGVKVALSEDFDSFVVLLNSVLQKQHGVSAVHNAYELKLLYGRFQKNISLYTASFNGEIIAASLIYIYDNLVHTQYLASNDKGRELGALDLLIKTLIDKFSDDKIYFDFGISTENDGKKFNSGLSAQKESFGGRTITHMTYDLSVDIKGK